MTKAIQIRYINELEQWEDLFPHTKSFLVVNDAGQTIDDVLTLKMNKNESYTSLEVDNKLAIINEKISEGGIGSIPVSTEQPTNDSRIWFKIL